jgi:hypothetical protein
MVEEEEFIFSMGSVLCIALNAYKRACPTAIFLDANILLLFVHYKQVGVSLFKRCNNCF